MKRFVLSVIACVCVSIGMQAAINVWSTSINGQDGYGIYGWENPGDVAAFLGGTYDGVVFNNGSEDANWATDLLPAIKSADAIKLGGGASGEIIGTADLQALALLTDVVYLRLDNTTPTADADFSKIAVGSSDLLDITLPTGVTRAQVEQANTKLLATASGLKLTSGIAGAIEVTPVPHYWYTLPGSSTPIEYTGEVAEGQTAVTLENEDIQVPLTIVEGYPVSTYVNTKYNNEVTPVDPNDVIVDGKVSPASFKVPLTENFNYSITWNGTTYTLYSYNVTDGKLNNGYWTGSETIPAGTPVDSTPYYVYTYYNGQYDGPTLTYTGTVYGNETDGYYGIVENTYPDFYKFDVTTQYQYTYVDLNQVTQTTEIYTSPQDYITLQYSGTLNLTTTYENVSSLVADGVVSCVNSAGAMADADFLFTGSENAAYKSAQHVVVIGEIDDNDVAHIKSFTGLKLLDLSEATATKEQVAACVKDDYNNVKDIALLIPTPQTSDYTTGMSDVYYYQNSGLKNVSFYEMVDGEEEGELIQTRNLKVWGANSTLANLNIDPELIDNEMGISFLPNYFDANGGLNWPDGNYEVYGNVEEGFVANTLSQLDCVSIDMMWLKLNLLKYDFSSLNPETHYIVIPHNKAGYEAASDIDDRVDGTDYVYSNNIWVVGAYAGTAHPYSTGIAFSGNHVATDAASAAQNNDYEFNVTTNVTYIRQAGTLEGAAATLNQFQKNATRTIVFGEANADDLAAMQYVASTKVDLSILDLVDGAKISDYQNTNVQYLALPGGGAVADFVPSTLKTNCPALLGVGLYKEVTDVLSTAENPKPEEKDNKLYYASWQEGGVRVIMHMLPEAQITSTSNGVHAYKMWGPLNHADISNTDAKYIGDNGKYSDAANTNGGTIAGLLGKSTKIYDADLSMAWFPNQNDMNFNAAAAYDGITFVACELPRTRMTTIPAHAFENMQGLHYIAIPNIYTTIKENAFYEVGLQQVGDGSLVGPLQIDTYQVKHVADTYTYTEDNALIEDIITNGPLTVTLPESLGHNAGEGLYTGSMQFTTRVKDVYVMAEIAPICKQDAFGSVAYVGNNTYGGVTAHPFARDKYRMSVSDATVTEETEDEWICVLHFPAITVDNGENYNYTDPTREYCLYDETGEVDGKGMPVVWPNQSEMLRSYNQAVTGVTWNAWDRTRVEEKGHNNYNEFATEAGTGRYNQVTEEYNLDSDHAYEKDDYCGWHQFVLANTWLPKLIEDEEKIVDYVQLDWFTFCIPYNMTKKQVIELLGVPKSEDGITRRLNGVAQNADVLPDVRTLVAVTRYPFMSPREIKLHLSQNIVEQENDLYVGLRYDDTHYELPRVQANSEEQSDGNWVPMTGEENQVYIKGGYPYLIRAYVPADLANEVTNLGGFTLLRGTFGSQNAGYKYQLPDGYASVAPYEQKVQAYINEKDKVGVEDPRVYPALYDDTEDVTENIEDTPADERFIYTFVGQYWPQYLPLYSYYLGKNNNPAADATTQKKFYRATAKLDGTSEKLSKWMWNPYVAVITANADDKEVHEPSQKSDGSYTSSLSMDFNGYDDSFGKGKAFNGTGDPNGSKYVFVFDDGIDEDLSGETTSIGYFNGTPVLPANGKIYNMNGQFVGTSVGSLQKGLYVVNGKKFIIK